MTPEFSQDILLKHLQSHLRFHCRYLQQTHQHRHIWTILWFERIDCAATKERKNKGKCGTERMLNQHQSWTVLGRKLSITHGETDKGCISFITVALLFWRFESQTRGNKHTGPLVFRRSSTNWLSGLLCCWRWTDPHAQWSAKHEHTNKFTRPKCVCVCIYSIYIVTTMAL